MSVRLIRESSDTPNITNRDDARMVRYAYGGINGVMKDFGSELSYSVSGSKFKLSSGRIVLQGWEVDVDGAGWELDLSTVTGTQYHLVYLEVNVSIESAVIKSAYLTGSIPTIDLGDDLTQYPEGTARLPLYTFAVTNGVISSVEKKYPLLTYYGGELDNLNKWQAGVLKENTLTLSNLGTSSDVDYGVENVNLTPGKIYIFNCVTELLDVGSITMVLFYHESGAKVHSTTSHAYFGDFSSGVLENKSEVRLVYDGETRILRLQFWDSTSSGWFSGALLHYREL